MATESKKILIVNTRLYLRTLEGAIAVLHNRNLVLRIDMNSHRSFFTRKQLLFIALFLIIAIMTALPLAFQKNQSTHQPINQLLVFGDSLSDVGHVFRATTGEYPESPPYFQGRYSNGRVWVEQLADQLQLSAQQVQNFAWGGATTGQTGISGVPGVLAQVEQFSTKNQTANSQALYVIWAGANDYLYSEATPAGSIANLSQAVRSLSKIGATRFLIGNIPDLGNLPATRTNGNAKLLSQAAIAHNQALKSAIASLQSELKVNLIEIDNYAAYQAAIANPKQFGFTNVTSAYLEAKNSDAKADQFLFWDGIHPTTTTHKILSDRAFTIVRSTFAKS